MGVAGSKRVSSTVLKQCTLWKADRSPACRAVMMALDALNLNVTEVDVNMDKAEHRTPELLMMNSLQTLPILKDQDLVIADSHAISSYLVNRYSGQGYLLPLDSGSQALVDQLLHYDSGVLHPKFRAAAYPILYDDCRYVMPHHVAEIESSYSELESMLVGRSWFNNGPWPMLSDICLCASVSTLNVMVPIDKKRYPRLANWLYRMSGEMFYLTANVKGLAEFAKKIDESMVYMAENLNEGELPPNPCVTGRRPVCGVQKSGENSDGKPGSHVHVLRRPPPWGSIKKCKRNINDVLSERKQLLEADKKDMCGSSLILNDYEQQANEIIMKLKFKELDKGFLHPGKFKISKHFFDYKDEIRNTKLYKILQDMPKGALLHAHDTGILGPDYVLELTYLPDLYVCFQKGYPLFLFSKKKPETKCGAKWELMEEARCAAEDVNEFDAALRKYFTIVIKNHNDVYTDVNIVWEVFQQYFITTTSLFAYKPVWEQYFYDTLKACRDDKIMYVEIRSVLPEMYDLDGNVFKTTETAKSYKNVLEKFQQHYPDFIGGSLIYAPPKMVDNETVAKYLQTARELKEIMPDFFAGFDLVGQEDKGKPLNNFIKELSEADCDLKYFFHAGETNWYGMSSDENLFDAIVLGSKRIGHAFALIKHPVLLNEVKKRNIALEINLISNNVLKLVEDVRNHPLAFFLAANIPTVITSDDPGVWEAQPLTDDYYVAFVGVASRNADLRLLKTLVINSIQYSSACDKDKFMKEFENRWVKFIDKILKEHSTS